MTVADVDYRSNSSVNRQQHNKQKHMYENKKLPLLKVLTWNPPPPLPPPPPCSTPIKKRKKIQT